MAALTDCCAFGERTLAARCRTENARKSYVLTLPDSVPAEVNVAPEDTVQIIRY